MVRKNLSGVPHGAGREHGRKELFAKALGLPSGKTPPSSTCTVRSWYSAAPKWTLREAGIGM